jgi:hypothetical protein
MEIVGYGLIEISKAILCRILFDNNVVIVCPERKYGRTWYADRAPARPPAAVGGE